MSNDGVNTGRRRFLTAATTVVGAAGLVGAAVPFVGSWQPSARARAAGAPVRYDVSKVDPGAMVTVEWRGQPVFIVRRTPEALEGIRQVTEGGYVSDPRSQRSEQPDYVDPELRSREDEFLILVGLCTHLGCSPSFRPQVGAMGDDWHGGFFCACHGSRFDMAGRVYRGVPAPTNLTVPPHYYETEKVVMIGLDDKEEGA